MAIYLLGQKEAIYQTWVKDIHSTLPYPTDWPRCLVYFIPEQEGNFNPTKTFCFSFQFLNLRCRLGYYFSLGVCVCVCVAKRESKIERHAMPCMFVLSLYCNACHIITLFILLFLAYSLNCIRATSCFSEQGLMNTHVKSNKTLSV